MVEERYCGHKVATLLESNGFPFDEIECPYVMNDEGLVGDAAFILGNAQICNGTETPTCTQDMARRWLRDEKGVDIVITPVCANEYNPKKYYMWETGEGETHKKGKADTYEEALDDAMEHALERLA